MMLMRFISPDSRKECVCLNLGATFPVSDGFLLILIQLINQDSRQKCGNLNILRAGWIPDDTIAIY